MTSEVHRRSCSPIWDVTRSLSRPQVSDDNPFSEAQFKTLKYHPGFPGRFGGSRAGHRRSADPSFPGTTPSTVTPGIAMLTPDDVHHGRAAHVLAQRQRRPRCRLGGPPRTLRSRTTETQTPSRSGLDQSTRHTDYRRHCSVNRQHDCLKVVDRFRPGFMGKPGCVRSSACIWLFSSQLSTIAFSGGARYKPTTSSSLS